MRRHCLESVCNNSPFVQSFWDEGEEDGFWVNLKNGFADMKFDPCQPTHTIHEWEIKEVKRRMKDVRPCKCKECLEASVAKY